MLSRAIVPSLFVLALISAPPVLAASGEAVTILSGGEDAQNCFNAAVNAAHGLFTSREDLNDCNRALMENILQRRDRAGTYVNRAIVETSLSRYRDAFKDFQRAIKTMPGLPEPYVGRGNIYFLAGKLNKAIDDYTRALDLHLSRDHIAYLNRGMAYEKLGRLDVAEANYREALKAQPDWKLAQKKLSWVLAKQATEGTK